MHVSTDPLYVSRGHKALVYALYVSFFVMLLSGITAVTLLAFSPQTTVPVSSEDSSGGFIIQNFTEISLVSPPEPSLSDRYIWLIVNVFSAGTAAFALCTILLTALYGKRVEASER